MSQNEVDAVTAARGYFDAFLLASPDLVRKHFLPDATKTGAMYDYDKRQFMDALMHHTYSQIVEFATQYNVGKHMPNSEPQFVVLDIQDKTAVVKVTAEWATNRWGTDYVLLVKSGDTWMIAAIVWQSTV
jgi:hypothetical protein